MSTNLSWTEGPRGPAYEDLQIDADTNLNWTREDGYEYTTPESIIYGIKVRTRARFISSNWFFSTIGD